MEFYELFLLIKEVIISPYVIAATFAVIMYLKLVFYVAGYSKKDFTPQSSRHVIKAAPPEPVKEEIEPDDE